MVLNMGPQHPSTHGVLRLELVTDGELVTKVTPHIGYLHRCFEKHCENLKYQQIIPYVDRMDYLAAMNNEWGFALAVEKLLPEVKITPKLEYLRVLICELNRIASHLVAVGTYGLDVGTFTPFLYCFRDRERILDLFEWTSGARLLYNYLWIGGAAFDLPEGFIEKTEEFCDSFEKTVDDVDRMMSYNSIFIKRTCDIGVISPETAVQYGLGGPNLRGSGVKWDLRRDEPYSVYPELEFDVIVGTGEKGPLGSCWDRYMVRVREMRESVKIVRQVCARWKKSDWRTQDVNINLPRRIKPAAGAEAYGRSETPRGELAYYVVSDGNEKPYRVKARSPAFTAISCVEECGPGVFIADAVAFVGSLDIVLGEIDR
ncbi:MAG: NADH-quinone oxidoreductase subunit D [Planctomycetes bacterium]|nr:NADH-quinone oxidoreductase subunit D [Planctomycetota bacterium]